MPKKAHGRRAKGEFVMLLNVIMKSAAWRDLSGNAVKLLIHLMMLSKGNNGWGHKNVGGELFLGERQAAAAIGISRNTASRCFSELVDHGFLRAVRVGHFQVKVRIATVWRLTFQPYPRNHQAPTNEWRNWRAEQIPRAQKLHGTGAKIGHPTQISGATGARIGPAKNQNARKQPILIGPESAPHLDIPWGRAQPERGIESAWWGANAILTAQLRDRISVIAWLTKLADTSGQVAGDARCVAVG